MAMIKCPRCGKSYNDDSRLHDGEVKCPFCKNRGTDDSSNSAFNVVAWAICSALCFGVAWLLNPLFSWVGWLLAIISAFFVFPTAFMQGKEEEELRKLQKAKQQDFIQNNGINISKEYKYQDALNRINIRFIIDNVNKNFYLAETSDRFMKISYDDVLGCEIMADSEVTGGVKRAIVGGILAGETGAIVGAITSKKHIMSYKLVFYMNDVIEPKREIVLIDSKKSTKDADYKNAVEFAENIVATIKVILN